MSKYTEAIADVMDIICESNATKPTMVVFEQEKQSLWTAVEALQIADRLEQIIKNGTNRITEVLCKDCREKELLEALGGCQGICRAMSNVIDGYNQALADIRGDNNEN